MFKAAKDLSGILPETIHEDADYKAWDNEDRLTRHYSCPKSGADFFSKRLVDSWNKPNRFTSETHLFYIFKLETS